MQVFIIEKVGNVHERSESRAKGVLTAGGWGRCKPREIFAILDGSGEVGKSRKFLEES